MAEFLVGNLKFSTKLLALWIISVFSTIDVTKLPEKQA
jgi:hypothetical protein